jgi:leucyl/phenylalanyl-tRNA---protein transferase
LGKPPGLDPELLLRAYAQGAFPMADDRSAEEIFWVEPKRRAILPLDGFHLSRALAKTIRQDRFVTTADQAFVDVVQACAAPAAGRETTWINGEIEQAVAALHEQGHAHSIECWADGELAGGLYGVRLGRAFFGESMFSRQRDASKVAMAHLVARLRAGGFELLDCQFMTPHLASLGAIEISQARYRRLLDRALSAGRKAYFDQIAQLPDSYSSVSPAFGSVSPPLATMVSGPISGWRILHSLVQTS